MLGNFGRSLSCCHLQILTAVGLFALSMQVFSIFEDLGISVDVVATSEVSISLTLDPSKLWSRELIQQASIQSFCSLVSNAVHMITLNIYSFFL